MNGIIKPLIATLVETGASTKAKIMPFACHLSNAAQTKLNCQMEKVLTRYLHGAKVAAGCVNSYMKLSFIYETIEKSKL